MNEKVRFRDNAQLLKKLSIISNIIILVVRILEVVGLIIMKDAFYQSITEHKDEEGNYMMIGIFALLLTAFFGAIILVIVRVILSAITIIVGVKTNYKKGYSSLSIFIAIFICITTAGMARAFIESLASEFNVVYAVVLFVLTCYCVFNFIVQWYFYRINQKPVVEKNDSDDENNNLNVFI